MNDYYKALVERLNYRVSHLDRDLHDDLADDLGKAADAIETLVANPPTQEAYDAACAALWKHRDRADRYKAALSDIADDAYSMWNPANWQKKSPTVNHLFDALKRIADAAETALQDTDNDTD